MKQEFPSTPEEAFEASLKGAYYSKQMLKARQERRICRVPMLHQQVGVQHRFVGYYSNCGEPIEHYVAYLHEKYSRVVWGTHYVPHYAEGGKFQFGKSHRDVMWGLGLRPLRVVEKVASHQDSIKAVRAVLPMCWFDEAACEQGIAALDSYRKEWDEKKGDWKSEPLHNWASHGAKAFEGFARIYEMKPAGTDDRPKSDRERRRQRRRRGRRGYMTV